MTRAVRALSIAVCVVAMSALTACAGNNPVADPATGEPASADAPTGDPPTADPPTDDPPTAAPLSPVGESGGLRLELFAPVVCESSDWSGAGRNERYTHTDRVIFEIEWRVSGGTPPYTVQIGNRVEQPASGQAPIACRATGGLDEGSGWITTIGKVTDASGREVAARVQTYALAQHGGKGSEDWSLMMYGGSTYRFEGVVMTIPVGLTIEGFDWEHSQCGEESCYFSSCKDYELVGACEPDIFGVWTLDGGVEVWFGYWSKVMKSYTRIHDNWKSDRGIDTQSRGELMSLLYRWRKSVGQPPPTPVDAALNPAPLQISGSADTSGCGSTGDGQVEIEIHVSGGSWVPTGIEVNDELVGLARGAAVIHATEPCPEPGVRQMYTLNIHDLGSDPDFTETAIHVTLEPEPTR